MTKRSLIFVAFLTLLTASAFAQTDTRYYFAELRGSNEVPPNNSPAVGAAYVTLDANNLVTFEVDWVGMTNPPSLSHIHEQVAGQNGSVVVNFATNASQISGSRVKGTIQADPAVASRIRANPAGFYVNVHSNPGFPGGEIRGQLQPATEYDVAVAGNVTTGAGDRFVTDVRIFNPNANKVVALVEYLVSGQGGNTNATVAKPVEIPARGEAVLDDVTGASFLNSTGSTGALRVTSNAGLVVTSNIFNDQRGASPNRGTFGQFVPGFARASAMTKGVILHLANRNRDLANPQGFRTNIGFFNPNQTSTTVSLTLRDAAGNSLGTTTVTLGPLAQVQNAITAYFGGVDLSNASALTLAFTSDQPIFAYGAVNDNISGDSIFVPAQTDPGASQ